MKDIKQYLNLYLGVECIVNMKRYLLGATGKSVNLSEVKMRFDSINRNTDSDQCWGMTFDGEEGIEFYDCFNKYCRTYFHFVHSTEFKLILRPLIDMTEEEKWEIISELPSPYNTMIEDLDWIQFKADESIRCAPFLIYSLIPKLLSKSFDLFNLIPEGIAINKQDVNHGN